MQVLTTDDQALLSRLVRLAGGDSDLVVEVLSKPDRRSMTLTKVMEDIELLRDRAKTVNGNPEVKPVHG